MQREEILARFRLEIEGLGLIQCIYGPDIARHFQQKKEALLQLKERYHINVREELEPEIWYFYNRCIE